MSLTEIGPLHELHDRIIQCAQCPRLVAHRERVAREKVNRYRDWDYWGKPVPPFGDPAARLLVMGLAPAAHGGNRTGRAFTGDASGDWLFRSLHQFGFANSPDSHYRGDGLYLTDVYITNAVRCAPPENKPTAAEKETCRPWLVQELALLPGVTAVVALGKFAFDAYLQTRAAAGLANPSPRPRFGHGVSYTLAEGVVLIGSYHPSRQNTNTGKLTEAMFDAVFAQARAVVGPARPVENPPL